MKLEHGKRYLTRSGMITAPLVRYEKTNRFGLPDVDGQFSLMLWGPDGTFLATDAWISEDLNIVAEFNIDKKTLVEMILRNMETYFETDEDFGPAALACAEEILKTELPCSYCSKPSFKGWQNGKCPYCGGIKR